MNVSSFVFKICLPDIAKTDYSVYHLQIKRKVMIKSSQEFEQTTQPKPANSPTLVKSIAQRIMNIFLSRELRAVRLMHTIFYLLGSYCREVR